LPLVGLLDSSELSNSSSAKRIRRELAQAAWIDRITAADPAAAIDKLFSAFVGP
jgi:hypothetical protein